MFGPVFRRELSAAARGSRLHGLRWLYGLLVLAQVVTFLPPARLGPDGVLQGWRFEDLHAELLFWRIAIQQVALLLLCTPAFAAGAFTAEKVRGTLLPLFVTPLTSWQIVCDKFLARLAQLLLLSLTGLPALAAAATFWEGQTPPVLPVAVAFVGPVALVTAVSLLASVWCRTSAEAMFASYSFVVVLTGVIWASGDVLRPLNPIHVLDPELIAPGDNWQPSTAALKRLVDPTSSSPPILETAVLAQRAAMSGLCWAAGTLVCLALAAWRLKPAYFAQLAASPRRTSWKPTLRPAVGNRPCFWREFHVKGLLPWPLFHGLPAYLLWVATGVGTAWVASLDLGNPTPGRFCLLLGLIWAVVTPLLVLLRCTATVALDRDPLIWETIHLTPLESSALVWDTLQGTIAACLRGVSGAALALLVVGAIAGPPILAVLLLLMGFVGVAVYAVGAGGLSASFRATNWITLVGYGTPLIAPIALLLVPVCCGCALNPVDRLLTGSRPGPDPNLEVQAAVLIIVMVIDLVLLFGIMMGFVEASIGHLRQRRTVVPERATRNRPSSGS